MSPEPVAAFLEHCYEPIRLAGQPKLPVPGADPGWVVADEAMRAAMDIKMPGEILRIRPPTDDRGFLAAQYRKWVLAGIHGSNPDKDETRQRCRIIFEGEEESEIFVQAQESLEGIFGSVQGARNYEVLKRCGYRKPKSWTLRLWSITAHRNRSQWRVQERKGRSTCVRPSIDRFYTKTEMIYNHLFVRDADPRVAVIELLRTYRPDPDAPKARPKVTVQPLGTPADQGDDGQREEQDKER